MVTPWQYFGSIKSKVAEKNDLDFDAIRGYLDHSIPSSSDQVLSDEITNDLDLDSVFAKIDRTKSRIGQQYLYAQFRTLKGAEQVARFDRLVEMVDTDTQLGETCSWALSKLSSEDGYCFEQLFGSEPVQPRNLVLPLTLTALCLLFLVLGICCNGGFILLILPVYVVNYFLHYRNKREMLTYLIAISELSKTLNVGKRLAQVRALVAFFQDTTFLDNLTKTTRKTALISFENRYDNELTSIFFLFVELLKIAVNYEVILFNLFLKDITNKRQDLKKLFDFIGEIDAANSVRLLKNETSHLCKPLFVDEKTIRIRDGIHPLVENCVANSLDLESHSLLLTGSNMSGKTTFIRSIAINAILAQTIGLCYASSYVAPYVRIFTSIRIRDDVENNASYYLKEVLTIKEFVDQVSGKERCLFVLDELFKGTNTLERVAAGKSILEYLNSRHHLVLVSTHDVELTTLLKESAYDSYHFSEQVVENRLLFDYTLHRGRLQTRNAIKILSLYDFPPAIIRNAIETQNLLSSGDAKSV